MKSIHKPLIYAALAASCMFGGCAANAQLTNITPAEQTVAVDSANTITDSVKIREDSVKVEEEKFLREKLKEPLTIERRTIIDQGLIGTFGLKNFLFDNKDEEFESVTFLKSDSSCYGLYKISDGTTTKEIPKELNPKYVYNAINAFQKKKTSLILGANGNASGATIDGGIIHKFSDSLDGFVKLDLGNNERGVTVGSSQQKGDVVFKEQTYLRNYEDEIFAGVGAEASRYIGDKRGNGIVVGGGLEKVIGRDGTYLKIKLDRVLNEFGRKKSLNSNNDCYTSSSDEVPFSIEARVDPFTKQARATASLTPFFDIRALRWLVFKEYLYYDQEIGSKARMSVGVCVNKIPGLDKLMEKVPFDIYIGVMPVQQDGKWTYQLDLGF